MSTLGIEVATTVEPMETDYIVVEGAESTDALGAAICQSSLTIRMERDGAELAKPLELTLKMTPDTIEPVFSGASWAGTVLWRAAARLVDRALLAPGAPASLVDLLERNVAANFAPEAAKTIDCRELFWSREKARELRDELLGGAPVDVILCCDCVYVPLYGDCWIQLLEAIDALAGPTSDILIAVERRHVRDGDDGVDAFLAGMAANGFAASELATAAPVVLLHFTRRAT
ncbi:lysine methyltransferase [Aureococcus anophagefferens]|nr:lysine methyltransferase [Aureococcus anophagefferens]